MLDKSDLNKPVVDVLGESNKNYFSYEVWDTNYGFTNKSVALMKKVIEFLNK